MSVKNIVIDSHQKMRHFDTALKESEQCIRSVFIENNYIIDEFPGHSIFLFEVILSLFVLQEKKEEIANIIKIRNNLSLKKRTDNHFNMATLPLLMNFYLRMDDMTNAENILYLFKKIRKNQYAGLWITFLERQYMINGFYHYKKKDYDQCLTSMTQWTKLETKTVYEFEIISLFVTGLSLYQLKQTRLLTSVIDKMHRLIYKKKSHNSPAAKALYKLITAITQTDKDKAVQRLWKEYNQAKTEDDSRIYELFDVSILLS